jgi:hypothetical protein
VLNAERGTQNAKLKQRNVFCCIHKLHADWSLFVSSYTGEVFFGGLLLVACCCSLFRSFTPSSNVIVQRTAGRGSTFEGLRALDCALRMELKTVIVGDADVGKTCLSSRYCHGAMPPQSTPTIGASFLQKRCSKFF